MAFQRIARADEIPPGETRFFIIGSTPLVLANWEGKIYAVHGLCPHRCNPLEGARLWDNLLTCPWHQFQYDVATGENRYPNNVYPPDARAQLAPLKTYRVEIRQGVVWVDL